MRTLRLYGIGIDAVRDIFGADPELAERLRASARTLGDATPAERRTLLGKLGPLFKRAPATEVDANRPLARDVDALLSGGYVPPDRASQSWQVMHVWLGDLADCVTTVTIDDLDDVEFDLARVGLSSEFSLRRLAERDLGIPLRPLPGQVVGYAKHRQAVETHHELARVLADPLDDAPLRSGTQDAIQPLMAFLEQVADTEAADVVTVSLD